MGNRIQQWYPAADLGCPDGTGTCSVTPILDVVDKCQWWIQTCNRSGLGPWSGSGSFTAPKPPIPVAATPGSPSGQTTDTTPTYTWNAVPWATWYQLYVNDSQGNKIQQWYAAADLGCPDGTGTCSVTPTVELGIGPCQWWIQTYNRVGLGPWSGGKSFTFPPPPTAVTQTWPSGTITDSTPAYIWNAVSGATWYQLYVNDSTGIKIQKWFTASEVGCETGTGTCSVKPTTALGAGAGQWWVQTYSSGGFGPWSLPGRSFTVSPPGQVLIGTVTNSILTFNWDEVSGATWYRLWVNDSGGNNKIQNWYTASNSDDGARCASSGICSVPSPKALDTGTYYWWIQTFGNAGYGPWSAQFSLTVP
jgi:hypothetical protein